MFLQQENDFQSVEKEDSHETGWVCFERLNIYCISAFLEWVEVIVR